MNDRLGLLDFTDDILGCIFRWETPTEILCTSKEMIRRALGTGATFVSRWRADTTVSTDGNSQPCREHYWDCMQLYGDVCSQISHPWASVIILANSQVNIRLAKFACEYSYDSTTDDDSELHIAQRVVFTVSSAVRGYIWGGICDEFIVRCTWNEHNSDWNVCVETYDLQYDIGSVEDYVGSALFAPRKTPNVVDNNRKYIWGHDTALEAKYSPVFAEKCISTPCGKLWSIEDVIGDMSHPRSVIKTYTRYTEPTDLS